MSGDAGDSTMRPRAGGPLVAAPLFSATPPENPDDIARHKAGEKGLLL